MAKTLEQVIKALVDLQKSASLRKEAVATVLAVVWTAFAFLIVKLARDYYLNIESPVLIALVLLPLIVYFVHSGKLTELKVLGAASAKFNATGNERPVSESTLIAYDDPHIVTLEGGVRKLLASKAKNPQRPVVMILPIDPKVKYNADDVKRRLGRLSPLRNFKLVVFLDKNKHVVAYMEAWRFKELIEQPELAREFVQLIDSGQSVIDFNPSVATETISMTSTNFEALRRMQEQNLEALVVVDEQKILLGVVEREQVLARIILSLAP
jgi:hypothetical protein